jgi:hypothetical protein
MGKDEEKDEDKIKDKDKDEVKIKIKDEDKEYSKAKNKIKPGAILTLLRRSGPSVRNPDAPSSVRTFGPK